MSAFAFPFTSPFGGAQCNLPPCDAAVYHAFGYFIDLWERIYPQGYLDPLKSPGPGYEILQAYAKIFERMSLAAARTDCGAHILSSFGAMLSTGEVKFSRPNASLGAVTIKAGSVVTTSKGGRDFLTTADLSFGATEVGPLSVGVIAVRAGWEYDVPGKALAADGTVLPGDIDTVKVLIEDPKFGDPTFVVTNDVETCGGAPAMLDGLGADRGLPRRDGESDEAYKARIRRLPDTVSPGAFRRALADVFAALCETADFIETWDITYQTCWDAPSPNIGTPTFQVTPPTNPLFDSNLFTYDDPRPPYPFRNRWLDELDYRGAVIIVVPDLPALTDVGMAYDDTAMDASDLLSPCTGTRAMSAYDVVPSTPVPQGGYDGFDLAKSAVYKGLFDLLDAIKAAGIVVEIELRGQ